jgi:hypothetical protein
MGPILIFDKSSLESLNLDEAVLLDNFYNSVITPLFFVECLADLEKQISSSSTPEQLVGSLADRTPEDSARPNVHHSRILLAEFAGQFNLNEVRRRPLMAGGKAVELEGKKGMLYRRDPESEALSRWRQRQFLEVERNIAKGWRRSLQRVNFDAMTASVVSQIGPWRKAKSLADARQLTETIVDSLDPEFLFRFGLDLLGHGDLAAHVVPPWRAKRKPPLRECAPYFIFLLSINIFFCLTQRTQLLTKAKASHVVDLTYLYYLPFCSVFTSKDNFHAQIAPLFLTDEQSFVNGIELKQDLKRLDSLYSNLPESELKGGLVNFARQPPEDTSFLTTRLWDRHLPDWRKLAKMPPVALTPEQEKELLRKISRVAEAPECQPGSETNLDNVEYVVIERKGCLKKGKYFKYSAESTERILEHERKKATKAGEESESR